ncbi:MAG: GNAT family N-acetyltransferase [Sterolibacterium sp.]|nr:GNAT family N-acetyltransferase [Sterolibacterium sp.]
MNSLPSGFPAAYDGRYVRLATARLEDAATIARLRNAARHCFLNDDTVTTDQVIQWLQTMHFPTEALLRIESPTGALLGFAGWNQLDIERREAEIGRLMIDTQAVLQHIDNPHRQDIAVDAVRAIGHYLYTRLGLQRIHTAYIAGNRHAARVNRRCGMQAVATEVHARRNGTEVRLIRLSLDIQDWRTLQSIWAQEAS